MCPNFKVEAFNTCASNEYHCQDGLSMLELGAASFNYQYPSGSLIFSSCSKELTVCARVHSSEIYFARSIKY